MKSTPNKSMPSYNQQAIRRANEGVLRNSLSVPDEGLTRGSEAKDSSLKSGAFGNCDRGGEECFLVDDDARGRVFGIDRWGSFVGQADDFVCRGCLGSSGRALNACFLLSG